MKKCEIFPWVIGIIFILLSTGAMAAEWDNVGSYDDKTSTMTITDNLGLGSNIAQVTLLTPHHYLVMPGKDRMVAELEINLYDLSYLNVFNNMKFYDLNKAGARTTRDFKYKYKTITGYNTIQDSYQECYTGTAEANGTKPLICNTMPNGSRLEPIYGWRDYNMNTPMLKGNITIGIFTEVYDRDFVEWIPTIYGVEIPQWANFTASLMVGLISYHSFDGDTLSDALIDDVNLSFNLDDKGNGHIVLNTTFTRDGTGAISTTSLHQKGDLLNFTTKFITSKIPFTINFWQYAESKCYGGAGGADICILLGTGDEAGTNINSYSFAVSETNKQVYKYGGVSGSLNDYGGQYSIQIWQMFTLNFDGTTIRHYTNNTLHNNVVTPWTANGAEVTEYWRIFSGGSSLSGTSENRTIDEFAVWNRSLSTAEMTALWNNGRGLFYNKTESIITLNSPANGTHYYKKHIFNCSADWVNITNLTLVIDGINNYTVVNITGAPESMSLQIVKSVSLGQHNWTCSVTNSFNTIETKEDRNFTIKSPILSFCNTTNKISYINFSFKDEMNSSVLNGTLPTTNWYYYLSEYEDITGSLYWGNVSENENYPFCFIPPHMPIKATYTVQYARAGYPERRYSQTNVTLSNLTTNIVLYLLSSTDGSYVTVSVIDQYSHSIQGVLITVTRQLAGGSTVTVSQDTTSDDGAATFWLNPDYDHTFTLTKVGYSASVHTIRPTQSLYTFIMSAEGGGTGSYYSQIAGLDWVIGPGNLYFERNTNYTFFLNVTANYSNMVSCIMTLKDSCNATGANILSTVTGCGINGGYISINMNSNESTTNLICGEYGFDMGNGTFYVERARRWLVTNRTTSDGTLRSALKSFTRLTEPEQADITNYISRVIFSYFFLVILVCIISLRSGFDLSMPGGLWPWVGLILVLLSVTGFFYYPGLWNFSFMEKMWLVFTLGPLTLAFFSSLIRRTVRGG